MLGDMSFLRAKAKLWLKRFVIENRIFNELEEKHANTPAKPIRWLDYLRSIYEPFQKSLSIAHIGHIAQDDVVLNAVFFLVQLAVGFCGHNFVSLPG